MILITGASSGIGLSCAELFAKQKRDLFLIARRKDRLRDLKAKLESREGIRVECAELDVRDKKAVGQFANDHKNLLEQTTVLVNNAGLAKGRELIQDGKTADWDVMWDTNVKGLLYITHAVLPHFVKKNSGHIINMGSVASRWAYPRGNIYAASKRAVSSLTESLRLDLLGTKIRVTEIAPGMVETEFSLVRFNDAKVAKAVYEGIEPLTPDDIAEAVVWAVARPARVNIQEIVIYPTMQASTNHVFRS